MYTLLSASVLALDLSRHPQGASVADVVDTALSLDRPPLDPAVLDRLARDVLDLDAPAEDTARSAARSRLLERAAAAPTIVDALRTATLVLHGTGARPVSDASDALRSALIGRLDDLLALLQDQLGEQQCWPQASVDLVLDRVVAAWSGPQADADDLRVLRSAWDGGVAELLPVPPRAVHVEGLLELLEAVARCDARQWSALDALHQQRHRGTGWSELVHEATRAASSAGRVVDVARWQLSAVRAAQAAGHVRTTCAPGAMMSVVGAVQALCVQDVAPPAVVDALHGPCRAVLGVLP